ncbi:MAG: glycosyltransferase family 2 protein [Acidimicrobiales bacterium]
MTRPVPSVAGRVSVVVLNWNSDGMGADAVASAVAQTWPDIEIVVVDNASTDDSLDRILAEHPDVTVVRNDTNLAFARGMNSGIAVATGEFVLPLNCDATLSPTYVATLVDVLHREPRAAAAGGLVESTRAGVSGPIEITSTMRTRSLPTDHATTCDKLNGATPLFRRTALDQVIELFGGPYDPTYDMYGEDVDLALTLGRLGWRFHYEPAAVAQHVRSYGTAPKVANRRGRFRVSTLANRQRNIVRHGPRAWWLVSTFAATQDVGFVVVRLLRGDTAAAVDVGQAWRRVIRHGRADLRKRRILGVPRPR